MAKKPPRDPSAQEIQQAREMEHSTAEFDRFCAKCRTSYPASQESNHAGH